MSEKDYHDEFYSIEAEQIFSSPIFIKARSKVFSFLEKYGTSSADNYVLSLGSGEGSLEMAMASSVGKILGVELSESAVKAAKNKAKLAQIQNVDFQVGDIQEINYSSNSFDAVWAPALLHHIDDKSIAELLQRSISWLKPGGIFVSIDPSDRRLISLFRNLFADKYEKYHSPDERELDIKALSEKFQKAGFTEVKIHYTDYFLGPLAWLFPKFPRVFIPLVSALDSLLLSIPGIKSLASSFTVVAHKPKGQ
jgi:ubiquinone/menaquinone biosynthesis C-methylase UbiE